LQLRVFCLGFLQDGDVGVGVFPEGKEILVAAICIPQAKSAALEIPIENHRLKTAKTLVLIPPISSVSKV